LIATVVIIGGLSYLFNNSSASMIIEDFRTTQAIKKKQKIIKTNLTNYLNTVTKDGTVSVSFYNLGAESGSSAANSKYAKLYQAGSLETESNAHAVKTAASTYKLYLTAYLMNQNKMVILVGQLRIQMP
jgi:hypothetical protein